MQVDHLLWFEVSVNRAYNAIFTLFYDVYVENLKHQEKILENFFSTFLTSVHSFIDFMHLRKNKEKLSAIIRHDCVVSQVCGYTSITNIGHIVHK